MIFIECSAKTKKGIEEVFQEVVEKVANALVADGPDSCFLHSDHGSARALSEHRACICAKGAATAGRRRRRGGRRVLRLTGVGVWVWGCG